MSKLVKLKLVFGQKEARWGVQQNMPFYRDFKALWEFQRGFSKLIIMEPLKLVMKKPPLAPAEESPPKPWIGTKSKGKGLTISEPSVRQSKDLLNIQAQASVCGIQEAEPPSVDWV